MGIIFRYSIFQGPSRGLPERLLHRMEASPGVSWRRASMSRASLTLPSIMVVVSYPHTHTHTQTHPDKLRSYVLCQHRRFLPAGNIFLGLHAFFLNLPVLPLLYVCEFFNFWFCLPPPPFPPPARPLLSLSLTHTLSLSLSLSVCCRSPFIAVSLYMYPLHGINHFIKIIFTPPPSRLFSYP